MTVPNFLIIGAGKSGTTSLYHYLHAHPQIYMCPQKEPRFFAFEGEELDFRGPGDSRFHCVTDLDAYRALFEGASKEMVTGEATTWYLSAPKAPARIKHHVPDAKLIAVLRDPVERAFSSWLSMRREQVEPLADFAQAMAAETERIANNWSPGWHYKKHGFYHTHLERYFDRFDAGQIRIYLYEDFTADPVGFTQDICRFLGVDDSFVPDTAMKYNVSGMPRNKALHRALAKRFWRPRQTRGLLNRVFPDPIKRSIQAKLLQLNLRAKPELSPEVRKQFCDEYREDILRLQDLLGRNLSAWLES
jgi:hypothetical protein